MLSFSCISDYQGLIKILGDLPEEKIKVTTNTKELDGANLFIALKGEKFDAFDFIPTLFGTSVKVIVYNQSNERIKIVEGYQKENPQLIFVAVDNTTHFLQFLAKKHLGLWSSQNNRRQVLAITGSNGKTTTKEMLSFFMNILFKGRVHSTSGNYNNHIGVPLTILGITDKHDFAIIEMGTNHPGEIAVLCEIANPTAGIITNIGESHLEFFGDKKGVFEEKRNLYDYVNKKTDGNGLFVVNGDDDYLINLPHSNGLIRFGEDAGEILIEISGNTINIFKGKKEFIIKNDHLTGDHNFKNLACAFILASHFKKGAGEILAKKAKNFIPKGNRSVWIAKQDKDFYLDAYNANPASMKASVKGFVERCKGRNISLSKCLFIVGDMRELGNEAQNLHKEVGEYFKEHKIENIIYIGEYAPSFISGFGSKIESYSDIDTFSSSWKKLINDYDYFFLKASRTLQLESLVGIN